MNRLLVECKLCHEKILLVYYTKLNSTELGTLKLKPLTQFSIRSFFFHVQFNQCIVQGGFFDWSPLKCLSMEMVLAPQFRTGPPPTHNVIKFVKKLQYNTQKISVGVGQVSKSGCKMFKYFHKGFQHLNFFGGTSQKNHPVSLSTHAMEKIR